MYVIDYALTPIETIDGPAPAGLVVSGETLTQLREQASQRVRWMEEARAEREAARASLDQARRDIDAQRLAWQEAAKAQAQAQADTLAEAARQAAVAQTVEWLVDDCQCCRGNRLRRELGTRRPVASHQQQAIALPCVKPGRQCTAIGAQQQVVRTP
ncbi:hypothetical protein A9762_15170 [Pandoraea sp. ISTKB]|nr:hypothetical protein A9762_15170 [Pandoraea sp. ISTKB]